MEELKIFLSKYGTTLVARIVAAMKAKRKFGSGDLAATLKPEIVEGAKLALNITSSPELEFADKGRKPGKLPPIKPIAAWAKKKGLPESAAFGIARNISRFGIPASNFMKVATKGVQDEIAAELTRIYSEEIKKNMMID